MDLPSAEELSRRLQIAKDQIVREEYEVLFLRDIFASTFGPRLVFKGGTALRLAYGAPRFSDNLDFSILSPIKEEIFINFIQTLGHRYPIVSVAEARKKYYTLFALLKIKEDFLKIPFSIKIEISTRVVDWQSGVDFVPQRLTSLVSNIVVIGNTATLERMWQDKKRAVKTRKKSRDIYDLWYLAGRLNKRFVPPKHNLSLQKLRADLNRVLPQNERYAVVYLVRPAK